MNPCASCNTAMVSHHAWRKLTAGERAQHRAGGVNYHRALGLCTSCYEHARRRLAGVPVRGHRLRDITEDWTHLVDPRLTQSANVRHLAPRLGMTESALERTILRAKKLGLLERAA